MDEILQNLYLRLDTHTKYLAKNAEAQLLVKLIYQNPNSSFQDLLSSFQKKVKNACVDRLKDLLEELSKNNEISSKKGKYSIPKSKIKKIEEVHAESQRRLQKIISTFEPYFSSPEVIKDWLIDVTMCFFNTFSDDWLSDLCYNVSAVACRKDSILSVIAKRTSNNKQLDKHDRESLPGKFTKLILSKESYISDFLWEYGTSSFAAKLINNSYSIDNLTVETFRDSCCILDTNILMYVGLESSKYYKSLITLEKIFLELGVNVGILYITKEEYLSATRYRISEAVKIVESYDKEVLQQTDDEYLQSAITNGCKTESDFKNFFNKLMESPCYVYKEVPIMLLDDDLKLEKKIQSAQNDDIKRQTLNLIYRSVKGYDKKMNALIHDVGLITGAKYLREKGKFFILSQEVSVNTYAKKKPSINDLPIAIRIETLLNMLALNGSKTVVSDDYKSLFADMIREGLQPSSETFTVPDLSIMLDKNEQISKLPPDKIIEIAHDIHRKRLLGASDEEITVEMSRRFQSGRIEVVEDLAKVQEELSSEKRDNIRNKKEADRNKQALTRRIENDVRNEVKWKTVWYWVKFLVCIIILALLVILTAGVLGLKNLIVELLLFCITGLICYLLKPKTIFQKKNISKDDFIKEEVQRRLDNELGE